MRRLLDTAVDVACVLILTTVALAVTTVGMAMATVDRSSHAPVPSSPANGTSYATTYVCGHGTCR